MKHWIGCMIMLLIVLSACRTTPTTSTEDAAPSMTTSPTGTAILSPSAYIEPTTTVLQAAPASERVPGVINYFQEATDDVIQAPDEIAADTPFEVIIATFGDGCTSVGDATISMTDNVATITVTDLRQAGPCIQPLLRFPRTVTLQFASPGEGVIRVVGQRIGPETGGFADGMPVSLERHVRVQ